LGLNLLPRKSGIEGSSVTKGVVKIRDGHEKDK